jgi:hypothetical protein
MEGLTFAMEPSDLLTISVQFELDEIGSERLPDIAVKLLEAGYDTPSLRLVAGDMHPEMAETGPTFADALRELGVGVTLREAWLLRAESVAHAITVGTIAPIDGACDLYSLDHRVHALPELQPFLREYWRTPPPRTDAEEALRDARLRDAARALEGQLRSTVAIEQRRGQRGPEEAP